MAPPPITQIPRGPQLLRLCHPLLFPLPVLRDLPLRDLTFGDAFFQRRHQPSHVRRGEEAQYCLSTSLIGQQVPDRPPTLPPLGLL